MEDEGGKDGWVFQHREGEQTKISDIDEGFQESFQKV